MSESLWSIRCPFVECEHKIVASKDKMAEAYEEHVLSHA